MSRVIGLMLCLFLAGTKVHAIGHHPNTVLSSVLNADGTVRAGAHGTFDARGYAVGNGPNGQPVFRPTATRQVQGTQGAGDAGWSDDFSVNGLNGEVYSLVVSGTVLYAGGRFTTASGVSATNVAKWDGTAWTALGTGVGTYFGGDIVYAMALDSGGNLYVCGNFAVAGGVPAANVAKWNGTTWSALGAGQSGTSFRAMTVDTNGNVYVGGIWNGAAARTVFKWNGTTWTDVGGNMNGNVYALAADGNGNIFAGGTFTTVDGGNVYANRIAKWNGTAWSAMGTGIGNTTSGVVYSLAFDSRNNALYVGGNFGVAGGVPAANIARWNGTAWSALGAGLPNPIGVPGVMVEAVAVDASGNVYASRTSGVTVNTFSNSINKWDGVAWSSLGTGLEGPLPVILPNLSAPVFGFAMATNSSGQVYVGGSFLKAGGSVVHNVAMWLPSSSSWARLGTGVPAAGSDLKSRITTLVLASNGDLYAAGSFAAMGDVPAINVAKWNGTTWAALGTGLGPLVNTSTTVFDLVLDGAGNLYAGGDFFSAGGIPVNYVAKWDGTAWSALGTGVGGGSPTTLAVDASGNLYAGGDFVTAGGIPVNGIAKWNGTAWSALGTGISRSITDLAFDSSGNLYATGRFTSASGVAANNVAKWDGSAWSALGSGVSGLNGYATDLAIDNSNNVYVGGTFTTAGGVLVNGIAKWNGTAWSALGAVTTPGPIVSALATDNNGNVYAGRIFNNAGGTAVEAITKWNGTAWTPMGTGTSGSVAALATTATGVYVGGSFSTVGDGSKVMGNIGLYSSPAPPNLTGITPNSGPVGSIVALTGSNLTGARITFSGPSNNTVATGFTINPASTQITGIVVPSGAITGPITITTSGGNSNTLLFTVTAVTAAFPAMQSEIVRAYPNPAHSTLFVTLPPASHAGAAVFTFLDAAGRVVRTTTVALPATGIDYELSLIGLPHGVYTVQTQRGNQQYSSKFICY